MSDNGIILITYFVEYFKRVTLFNCDHRVRNFCDEDCNNIVVLGVVVVVVVVVVAAAAVVMVVFVLDVEIPSMVIYFSKYHFF